MDLTKARRLARAAVAAAALAAGAGLAATPALITAGPAGAATVPALSAGGGGSCAVLPDRTVWCWGSNGFGQLGNGGTTASMFPERVTLPPAASVSAGQAANANNAIHTCAVDATSRVFCWGSNAYGEIGVGTTSLDIKAPVQVPGLAASQVSAGDQFTCAVTLAHTAQCWGDNNFGELGDGTTADSSKPVKVKGLANVTEVAAGYFHACALESNGTVWCWGDNGNGELGTGTTGTGSDTPVQVPIEGVTSVAAGNSDSCAILPAGKLLCWGLNSEGQLGTGSFTDQPAPAPVIHLGSGVVQVGLGLNFGCALADIPGAAVLCWGDNGGNGTLGNGTFNHPAASSVPRLAFGLKVPPSGAPGGPQQITVGARHACAVMTSGLAQCWGQGGSGRLGDGDTLDRAIPTPVIGLPLPAGAANAVTAGIETSCAINSQLEAACWGRWVGDGGSLAAVHTKAVVTQPAASQVVAGWGGCALVHSGGLSTGVRCWGSNKTGQLGNGTKINARSPVVVKNLSNVQDISNGAADNCALVAGGGAWCWGYNAWGELGDGSTTSSTVPVHVSGLPASLAQIAAGFEHTCALLKNGTVRCWGQNSNGQLGDGSTGDSKTPVAVKSLSGVAQIAVGDNLSCALTSAGSVDCWGDGEFGELGNGQSGAGTHSDVPVQVSGLTSGAVAIAASDATVCAELFTGQVDCWGDNSVGELGAGPVGTPALSSTPVSVSGFSASGSSVGVSAGFGATACALSASQQAFCWGDNTVGELGDGASGAASSSGTPVAVQGL
jgi:alpha-tubulin suppressor-like RCC1 family protein